MAEVANRLGGSGVLSRFLGELFDQGHVHLDDGEWNVTPADREASSVVLTEREREVAAEFPGAAPEFDAAIALWAAVQFYTACRFVLYRAAPDDEVRAALSAPCPACVPAAAHYAVDLTWQFLPDLDRLTASLAPQDCLREIIRGWGSARPLSSVGMRKIEPAGEAELLEHPGLRTAYIDRIIAQQDSSRLKNPLVRDFVFAALGPAHAQTLAWCREPKPTEAAPAVPT